MISRTSLLAFAAAGAIAACGGSQQQQQANTPPNPATNAAPAQTTSLTSNDVPNASSGVANRTSTVDRDGEFGVSGAAGPEENAPGVSDVSVTKRNPSTVGVTNEQPAANPEDVGSLNDPQLAALVVGIHEAEIKQGELAESNAASPAVKKLAEHMVGAHRTLLANDRTVLARDRISPAPSALSEQKHGDADGQLATLQSMHGKDFDTAYVDDQIRGHKDALHLLDRIVANVKNADFKSDLQAERTHIEDHLREAQRTRDLMSAQGSTANPASNVDTNHTR
jgi:predicted outer membrane protein